MGIAKANSRDAVGGNPAHRGSISLICTSFKLPRIEEEDDDGGGSGGDDAVVVVVVVVVSAVVAARAVTVVAVAVPAAVVVLARVSHGHETATTKPQSRVSYARSYGRHVIACYSTNKCKKIRFMNDDVIYLLLL